MRIGVTGAFGFLGANFVSELLSRGGPDLQVRAFSSRVRGNPLFDPARVEVLPLDILDRESLGRAFRGLDAVAHFAGKVDYRAREKRRVWDSDVLGALNVFDAVLEAGVGRLLNVSSISVLGQGRAEALAAEASRPWADPAYPISFASPAQALEAVAASQRGDYRFLSRVRVAYFDSKLAARELAEVYVREKGLPAITIYPGTAVGPGDLHQAISSLVDSVWEGRLGMSLGGGTSFVSARDFARGARLALEQGRPGDDFVISGRDGENLDYAAFADLVASVARREGGKPGPSPLVMPRLPALAAGAVLEVLAPRAGLSAGLVRSASVRNWCSSAKARARLGYEPSQGLEAAISECRAFSRLAQATRRP